MTATTDFGVDILYPERRRVPCTVIKSWYADAIANKEIVHEDGVPHTNWLHMAQALHDEGLITLKGGRLA